MSLYFICVFTLRGLFWTGISYTLAAKVMRTEIYSTDCTSFGKDAAFSVELKPRPHWSVHVPPTQTQ